MARTNVTEERPSGKLQVLKQCFAEKEDSEAEHQADKKLLQLEDEGMYKAVFESANDSIMLIDKKGKIIDFNDRFTEVGGYQREKFIGKNIRSLAGMITGKSMTRITSNFLKRMAGVHVSPYEVEIYRKNGELLTVEISARPLRKDGRIIGDLAILRDVTERKRAENEIRQKSSEIRLINSINEAVNQGKTFEEVFQFVSRETQKLFGGNVSIIYLLSQDKQYLVMQNLNLPPSMAHVIEKLIGSKISTARIKLKVGGIYTEVLNNGKAVLTNDPSVMQRMASECTEDKTLQKLVSTFLKILGIQFSN